MPEDCHPFHTVVLTKVRRGACGGVQVLASPLVGHGRPGATTPTSSLAHSPWKDM